MLLTRLLRETEVSEQAGADRDTNALRSVWPKGLVRRPLRVLHIAGDQRQQIEWVHADVPVAAWARRTGSRVTLENSLGELGGVPTLDPVDSGVCSSPSSTTRMLNQARPLAVRMPTLSRLFACWTGRPERFWPRIALLALDLATHSRHRPGSVSYTHLTLPTTPYV